MWVPTLQVVGYTNSIHCLIYLGPGRMLVLLMFPCALADAEPNSQPFRCRTPPCRLKWGSRTWKLQASGKQDAKYDKPSGIPVSQEKRSDQPCFAQKIGGCPRQKTIKAPHIAELMRNVKPGAPKFHWWLRKVCCAEIQYWINVSTAEMAVYIHMHIHIHIHIHIHVHVHIHIYIYIIYLYIYMYIQLVYVAYLHYPSMILLDGLWSQKLWGPRA